MSTLRENLEEHNEIFNDLIENLELNLEAGTIDEDEFEQLVLQARADLQERIDAELGIEHDEEEYATNYSDGGDYANFSVGSSYGQALLELGAEAYYDEDSDEYDIEGLCYELGALSGYEPEDIYGVITGELEPSDELSLDIADSLGLDEDTESQLLVIGIETRGDNLEDYLDLDEEDDDEDEEYLPSYEDEYEEASYSRVNALEEEVANFKAATIVQQELADLENRAWDLVQNGQVPPIVVEKLLGSFSSESDRVAAFSAVCQSNNTDAGTELYAMAKTIAVLESMPVIANFGFEVQEPITREEYEEEQTVRELASGYLKNRRWSI